MLIEDEFRVNVPVEEAWSVLLDLERIAPCMPGAQLQEVEGDEYRGTVKVKVGPITAQYKGAARLAEVDEAARRAVIRAEGRDTRGQGNASATITAELAPDADGTKVRIESDVTITGKVAQFGRGVIADVSTKLLGQFVENLERDVLVGSRSQARAPAPAVGEAAASALSAPAPAADEAAAPEAAGGAVTEQASEIAGPTAAPAPPVPSGPRKIDSPEAEPVDLLGTAGTPVLKRLAPIAVVLVLLAFVLRRRRRSRRRAG